MLQLFHEKIRNFKKFYTFWRFDISIHILKIFKKKKKNLQKKNHIRGCDTREGKSEHSGLKKIRHSCPGIFILKLTIRA